MTVQKQNAKQIDRLVDWGERELGELVTRLRSGFVPSAGREKTLWEKLISRLEKREGALTVDEAADSLGFSAYSTPEKKKLTNNTANDLRKKIKAFSRTLSPNPGVYLSTQTYALRVTQPPPREWKRVVGPAIGLLLADAADWFVGDLVRGVTEVCNSSGHDLLLDVSNCSFETEAEKLEHLLTRADGAMIVPVADSTHNPTARKLLQERPCVLVDRYMHDLPNVFCVHHDDISAGRQAALHLKECGCKRVLIIDQAARSPNPLVITPLIDRVAGCEKQLHRSKVQARYLPAVGSDEQGGFATLQQFDKNDSLLPTDGIFALTDRLALGCRHYLNTRTPRLNLHLIGTEGQTFGDFIEPALTSIHFDVVEMGRLAATVLLAKLKKRQLPKSNCLPHFLIAPTLLKASSETGRRQRTKITFADAADHYPAKQ